MTHASHTTRYSDSSYYDEVCTRCGSTDAPAGGLNKPCPKAADFKKPERFVYVIETMGELSISMIHDLKQYTYRSPDVFAARVTKADDQKIETICTPGLIQEVDDMIQPSERVY